MLSSLQKLKDLISEYNALPTTTGRIELPNLKWDAIAVKFPWKLSPEESGKILFYILSCFFYEHHVFLPILFPWYRVY